MKFNLEQALEPRLEQLSQLEKSIEGILISLDTIVNSQSLDNIEDLNTVKNNVNNQNTSTPFSFTTVELGGYVFVDNLVFYDKKLKKLSIDFFAQELNSRLRSLFGEKFELVSISEHAKGVVHVNLYLGHGQFDLGADETFLAKLFTRMLSEVLSNYNYQLKNEVEIDAKYFYKSLEKQLKPNETLLDMTPKILNLFEDSGLIASEKDFKFKVKIS